MRESLCVALEAEWVAPWTKVLQSIHWLEVYSCKVQMSDLVHWEGLKVLFGTLYCMKVDIAALQCNYPHNMAAHHVRTTGSWYDVASRHFTIVSNPKYSSIKQCIEAQWFYSYKKWCQESKEKVCHKLTLQTQIVKSIMCPCVVLLWEVSQLQFAVGRINICASPVL